MSIQLSKICFQIQISSTGLNEVNRFSFHGSQLFYQIQLNVNVKICCESVVVYCKAYVSLPSLARAFPARRCRHARIQNDNAFSPFF